MGFRGEGNTKGGTPSLCDITEVFFSQDLAIFGIRWTLSRLDKFGDAGESHGKNKVGVAIPNDLKHYEKGTK